IYPYEELAKYYEHKLNNYSKARTIVEEALLNLEGKYINPENKKKWQQNFRYRLARIKRKEETARIHNKSS
ncbi:MAG: hypothetical protein ACOC5R_04615, partial [Elusimicrobiota bacterium]